MKKGRASGRGGLAGQRVFGLLTRGRAGMVHRRVPSLTDRLGDEVDRFSDEIDRRGMDW